MKIDIRNPAHWLYLVLTACWVLLAIALRPLRPRSKRKHVLLYGHKLSGNLLAVYRQLRAEHPDIDVAFLTMDPVYHRQLLARGEASVLAVSPACLAWLVRVDALVSDHGLHALLLLLYLSDVKFFDVWHGIPFKGFDADDFRVQHRYEEAWVASPLMQKLYVDRFGFAPERVHATGYARTDILVRKDEDRATIRRQFGLPETGKVVLFAPTWKQDAKNRSLYPFGIEQADFLTALTRVARRHGAVVALRTHLNSGENASHEMNGIVPLPFARFPDTERLLLAADLLICDWSSIAFDFLLLDRPTVFLDVEPPFRKGLSLDASWRYGAVVSGLEALESSLDQYLADPGAYAREYGDRARYVREGVYGGFDDGNAAARCIERLRGSVSAG